jgi:4'-phosphopantetheinyl transferase EntD
MLTDRSLLQELLPSGVVSVDALGDADPGGSLFVEEEQVVAQAVATRVRQFTQARRCAHVALAAVGAARAPLLPGPDGAPRWPEGIVGSITHCEGYSAAAVARRTTVRALGVDAEPHAPLPRGVTEQVTLPWERERIRALMDGVSWDRLLFGAKECVYKVWSPLTGCWLGFDEALVDPWPDRGDPTKGELRIRLLKSRTALPGRCPVTLTGRYAVRRGLVLTAVAVVPP